MFQTTNQSWDFLMVINEWQKHCDWMRYESWNTRQDILTITCWIQRKNGCIKNMTSVMKSTACFLGQYIHEKSWLSWDAFSIRSWNQLFCDIIGQYNKTSTKTVACFLIPCQDLEWPSGINAIPIQFPEKDTHTHWKSTCMVWQKPIQKVVPFLNVFFFRCFFVSLPFITVTYISSGNFTQPWKIAHFEMVYLWNKQSHFHSYVESSEGSIESEHTVVPAQGKQILQWTTSEQTCFERCWIMLTVPGRSGPINTDLI